MSDFKISRKGIMADKTVEIETLVNLKHYYELTINDTRTQEN